MSKFVAAAALETLVDGGMRSVQIGGRKMVLVRIGEQVFALKDECTHEEFPLSEGWVEDGCVCCAFHGAKFDPQTGEALSLPAYQPVQTFPVRIQNGIVEIDIE